MPSIIAPGVGSGLDIGSIVSQLMALERRPLVALSDKQRGYEAQLSAYGKLKSAVASFKSAMGGLAGLSKFKLYKATSGDEDVYTASASSSAAIGSYSVQVNRIAEAHKLASDTTFADSDTTTIGASGQTLTITVGASAFTVSHGGKTLAQIRDAINDAADNSGATATVLQDDSGYRLLLTANATGSTSALGVSYSAADPFSLQTLNQDRNGSGGFTAADLDASLLLEGTYTITRSSNAVADVIQGVTLNLKAAGSAALTVARDTEAVTKTVQGFVDAYNALRTTVKELRSGGLKGDLSLISIEAGIQGVLNNAPSGLATGLKYLSEIGVAIQKDGKMALDKGLLNEQLALDFNGVAELFAHDAQGYAYRLNALASNYLQADGVLDAREDGLNARIDSLADRKAALELRLESIERRLRAQYSALDSLVGSLRATGDYLARQLQAFQALR